MKTLIHALVVAVLVPAAWAGTHWTDAEVRKVDKDAGKITLRHGEITNLGMPPMTMVFQVQNHTWLESLKAGDKVRFAAEKSDSGYVVIDIEPAR
jgi:Cu/Ag efflux protein CusF